MTKFLITLTLFFVFAVSASAQTFINTAETKTKIYVGFINGSYDLGGANNQGVNGSAQIRLYGYEGVKVEAVGDFSAFLRGRDKVYAYLAGPQVSVDLIEGRLTPFVRIMFGATRYDGQGFYSHSVGGGVDVNISKRYFIRPFQYDKQSTDTNFQPVHRIGFGAGFRF